MGKEKHRIAYRDDIDMGDLIHTHVSIVCAPLTRSTRRRAGTRLAVNYAQAQAILKLREQTVQ